jgi:hypothetical protein
MPVHVIQALLGHTPPDTAMIYAMASAVPRKRQRLLMPSFQAPS